MVSYTVFGIVVIAIFVLSGALVRTIRSRDMWKREATLYLSAIELDVPLSIKTVLSDPSLGVSRGYHDQLYYVQSYNIRGNGRTLLSAIVDYTQYNEAVNNVRALRGETV